MKDPTAIGNYPHFYSTSCSFSFSHPRFLPPSLSFSLFFRHFYTYPRPLLPLLVPYLERRFSPPPPPGSFPSPLFQGRFLALDISTFPSRRISLFKPVKSHVTHRRLPARAGSPRGILPRHTARTLRFPATFPGQP